MATILARKKFNYWYPVMSFFVKVRGAIDWMQLIPCVMFFP